jgi:hypothetical protein
MIAQRAGFPEHEVTLDVSFPAEQSWGSPLKLSC